MLEGCAVSCLGRFTWWGIGVAFQVLRFAWSSARGWCHHQRWGANTQKNPQQCSGVFAGKSPRKKKTKQLVYILLSFGLNRAWSLGGDAASCRTARCAFLPARSSPGAPAALMGGRICPCRTNEELGVFRAKGPSESPAVLSSSKEEWITPINRVSSAPNYQSHAEITGAQAAWVIS